MQKDLNSLLSELDKVFDESDIKQYCLKNEFEWHYSLITTTMERNGPLVLGFNWGAKNNERYNPQSAIGKSNFEYEDVGSLARIYTYCRKYYGNDFLSKTSQSNYCFFRSKKESQISISDMTLCEPIFEKLIEIICPSTIICLSSKLRDYLFKYNKIETKESISIKYKMGERNVSYEAIKARLTSGIQIKFLPHPAFAMKGEARDAAWEFCCGND